MFNKKQYIILKESVNIDDMLYLSPYLISIVAFINVWCHERGIAFKINSMHREPDKISVSKTHQTFRAIDFSLKGWTQKQISELEKEVERRFKDVAAISARTGNPNAMYVHKDKYIDVNGQVREANTRHAHLQVRPLRYIKKQTID